MRAAQNGSVPETPERAAQRKRRAREDTRRRQAVAELRVASAVAAYAAEQVSNGLSAAEARRATVDAAAELAEIAVSLRRLARLRTAERRSQAALLAAAGVSRREVAVRVGVSESSVWKYLAGRRG